MDEPLNTQPLDDTERRRKAYHEAIARDVQPFQLADAFPVPADLAALFAQLTALKGYLDEFRPFEPHQLEKLREAFDTEYTYHSNRIEGNTLTLGETHLIINKGLTVGGKTMREHIEAINHAEAVNVVRALAGRNQDVSETVVNDLHALIMRAILPTAAGRYRDVRVTITGSQHIPPNYAKVPALMADLYAFYEAHKATMHPVQLAADMHHRLVAIHPFQDGNGRTSRLLMNLILLRNGYPVTVISGDRQERLDYYSALEHGHTAGHTEAFRMFVARNVRTWLLKYLDMVTVNGSDYNKGRGTAFLKAIEPHLGAK
jgi:Fic family protein